MFGRWNKGFPKVSLAWHTGLFYWVKLILLKLFAPSVIFMLSQSDLATWVEPIAFLCTSSIASTEKFRLTAHPLLLTMVPFTPQLLWTLQLLSWCCQRDWFTLAYQLQRVTSWRLLLSSMRTMLMIGNLIVLFWVSLFLLVSLQLFGLGSDKDPFKLQLMVLNLMLCIWPLKRSYCPFATCSVPLECLLPMHLASLVTIWVFLSIFSNLTLNFARNMTLELMVHVTLTLIFESHADCCLSLYLFVFVCSLMSTEEEVRSWASVCHLVSPTWPFLTQIALFHILEPQFLPCSHNSACTFSMHHKLNRNNSSLREVQERGWLTCPCHFPSRPG